MRHHKVVGMFVASVAACVFSLPTSGQLIRTADPVCTYNRAALLALDQRAVDQDMRGGWRALAQRDGCMEAAADLLRAYRERHGQDALLLYWHEGQLRATLGATEEAIELFKKAYDARDTPSATAWNLYAVATIAFLQQDKSALLTARDRLASLPRPPGVSAGWPMNLN